MGGDLKKTLTSDLACLAYIALGKLALHAFTNETGFTPHPDYFVDHAARHADWGFSNTTPYGPALVFMSKFPVWNIEFTLRVFPAVLGAAVVFLVGLTARVLGAGRFGQCLSALAVVIAPYSMRTSTTLHSGGFELFFTVLAGYLIARILASDERKLWLAVGVVSGLGMLNKQTMGLMTAGLLVGLLATPARAHFSRRWLWFAAVLGLLVFSPYLIWQYRHGFPVFDYVEHQRAAVWLSWGLARRLAVQPLALHPINAPLIVAGLYFYLAHPAGKAFRPFGWIFMVTLAVLAVTSGRLRYGLPEYFLLLPGGARLLETAFSRAPWSKLRLMLPAAMIVAGVALLPLAIPIFTVERTRSYAQTFSPLVSRLTGRSVRMDSLFCERQYYEHFVDAVSRVFEGLRPDRRSRYGLFIEREPEAAAVNTLAADRDLPYAFANSERDFRRGPEGISGDFMIAITPYRQRLNSLYFQCDEVYRMESRQRRCQDSRFFADHIFYRCRILKVPLEDVWDALMTEQGVFQNALPPGPESWAPEP